MKNLNNIPDKNPFKVPDNYFEEINNKIMSSIPENSGEIKKPVKVMSLRTYLMIAATVSGIVLLSYTTLRFLTTEKDPIQAASLYEMEFHDPLMTELDIFSLEESVADMVLAEEGIDVNRKDIIEYLLLENIEISDIYAQL